MSSHVSWNLCDLNSYALYMAVKYLPLVDTAGQALYSKSYQIVWNSESKNALIVRRQVRYTEL